MANRTTQGDRADGQGDRGDKRHDGTRDRNQFRRVAAGSVAIAALGVALAAGQAPAPARQGGAPVVDDGPVKDERDAIIGFTKLAEIPGTPWRIHDAARPHPNVVTPGATPGAPSSDAIVLFDGKDLSRWGAPAPTPLHPYDWFRWF